MNFKPLIHKLGLGVLTLGEKWFRIPNVTKAERRGAFLSRTVWRFDKKHREQTKANLILAFPEKSDSKRAKIAEGMVNHFGYVVADFVRGSIRTDEEYLSTTAVEGKENFDQAIAEGKGVLLVSAHLGNWERFGHWFALNNVSVSGVARDANDDEITQRVTKIRGERGARMLSRGNAAREILVRLRKGEVIFILPDQNADDAYIPFFGHVAGTALGPAVLHLKTKAPILPACMLRTGAGTYRIVFREPMHAKGDEKAEELMTRVNAEIEAMIRMAPEQYLWMHDRWRNARRKGLL
ncbi:MAG: lysophospholipid acyltransferase family protein [Armatimonadetes bacterium]|nr:lysophospholipid acyltransferase family protein [Armatimonadota bacterium]